MPRRFHVGPPDLVVEVFSAGTAIRDLNRKRDLYAGFGAPEYWFANLPDRSLLVHRLAEGAYSEALRLPSAAPLSSPLLPGFRVDVAALFA